MFFILLFFILVVIVILNSEVQIEIYDLDISTNRKEKIKQNYKTCIRLILFNKIKVFKINIKKFKNKKININIFLDKINADKENANKKELIQSILKNLNELRIKIIKADLKVELGTEDAALTAISVGIIGSILGFLLKKQKFQVLPIYKQKNILNIKLNCIFRVNLMHYIYKTILKRREKNERKSSDRRTYAYSNE